jgi:hypothetical protein
MRSISTNLTDWSAVPERSIDRILRLNLLQDVVQFLSSSAWLRPGVSLAERSLLLWHVIKFLEVSVRHNGEKTGARNGGHGQIDLN